MGTFGTMCVGYIKVYRCVVHIDNYTYIILKVLFKPISSINVATNVMNEYCIGYNLYKLWIFIIELLK